MRSLRLKLSLGFLLVLAAVIAGFDIAVYTAKRQALFSALDGRLFAATQAASRHLEIDAGRPVFDPAEENGARLPLPPLFRVLDEKGRILGLSAGAAAVPWPADPASGPNPRAATIRSGAGEAWRISTWNERRETDTDTAENKSAPGETTVGLVVQSAESLAPTKRELAETVSFLTLVSLAAFLLAGFGGFRLAGRALRPIRGINAALEKVTETSLDGRLDPASFDTELRPLVGRLNEALERLEKGFRRERQFTADASHELRTPLTVLLSSIEVLLRKPRPVEELVEAHRDNEKTARTMQAVVESLLLLARLDAGGGPPVRESVSPAALVEEIFASFGPLAEARRVHLVQAIDPAFRILADPGSMRLALLNLIDNAIRYNRPDGLVSVEVRRTAEGAAIEVRDTGPGIPQEHLPRIFEPFYRVDPSRTEATGGSGLGLSIVRKIVEVHGGRVALSSSPEGSTFTIFLTGP